MRRTLTIAAVASTLLLWSSLGAGTASAQERIELEKLPVRHRQLVTLWLGQDCRNSEGELVGRLLEVGPLAEAAFWEAYDLGPTESVRNDQDSTASERWLLRHRWLEVQGAEAIGKKQALRLLAEPEEEFRNEEDARLAVRWRDAALSGLAMTCTERSSKRLKAVADDERNPSSPAARIALETSGDCGARGSRPQRPR